MSDAPATIESLSPAAAVIATSASPKIKKSKNSTSQSAKKPRTKPAHPPTSEMVNNAIKNLKERGGSSLQAIKKYITANYKIDANKLSPFIKKYLKNAVTVGELIQTKGKGASGSFKIAAASKVLVGGSEKKKVKKTTGEKSKVKKAAAKPIKKSASVVKKNAIDKKKSITTAAKSLKKSGSSIKSSSKSISPKQKPTKAKKGDNIKKPKAPKPKKVTATPKKTVGKK